MQLYYTSRLDTCQTEEYSVFAWVNVPAKSTAAYLKWRDLIASKRAPNPLAQPGLRVARDCDAVWQADGKTLAVQTAR
jgi:hypothetical protein